MPLTSFQLQEWRRQLHEKELAAHEAMSAVRDEYREYRKQAYLTYGSDQAEGDVC